MNHPHDKIQGVPTAGEAATRGQSFGGRSLLPHSRAEAVAFGVSAATGLAIWLPTMALQPRHDYGAKPQQGSLWFLPLMVGAAFVLTVIFAERWQMVAPGLVTSQLLLAAFTTPRGDNDGLWVLIFPLLIGFMMVLYLGCAAIAGSALWIRARRRGHRAS